MAAGMENEDLLQEIWVWAKEALTTDNIFSFRTYGYQFLAHISKVIRPRFLTGYMGVGQRETNNRGDKDIINHRWYGIDYLARGSREGLSL
jgi:hypothetical protein